MSEEVKQLKKKLKEFREANIILMRNLQECDDITATLWGHLRRGWPHSVCLQYWPDDAREWLAENTVDLYDVMVHQNTGIGLAMFDSERDAALFKLFFVDANQQ